MSKIILFDIDGTLILTGGAGMRALDRACEEITGLSDALADVPVAGRTDRIGRRCVARAGPSGRGRRPAHT